MTFSINSPVSTAITSPFFNGDMDGRFTPKKSHSESSFCNSDEGLTPRKSEFEPNLLSLKKPSPSRENKKPEGLSHTKPFQDHFKWDSMISPLVSPATKRTPSSSLHQELPLELIAFLTDARTQLRKMSYFSLDLGLKQALEIKEKINRPDDRTTLLVVAERIALLSLVNNNLKKALKVRMETAEAIPLSPPLADLEFKLQEDHPLGLKLYPLGASHIKNHTLTVHRRYFEGQDKAELFFHAKLTSYARRNLQTSISKLMGNEEELRKALPDKFCKTISIFNNPSSHYLGRIDLNGKKWSGRFSRDEQRGYQIIGETTVVHFKEVGFFKVGNTPNIRTEYHRITFELDSNIPVREAAEKVKIVFAALGLCTIGSSCRPEDIKRIQLLQLFRAFDPKSAFSFENKSFTFECGIPKLQNDLIARQQSSATQQVDIGLSSPSSNTYPQEVYPGQKIWAVKGLANRVKELGGLGLMTGIGGASILEAAIPLISILRIGALSTQDRFQLGIIAGGVSSKADLKSGGGDSIFLRLISQGMPKNLGEYPLAGRIQILINLNIVDRVGYVYEDNFFGTKDPDCYSYRPSIIELAQNIQEHPENYLQNEVCVHHRIDPTHIQGVRVNTQEEKQTLAEILRKEGFVTMKKTEKFFEDKIPLDEFIRTGEIEPEDWV